MSSLMWFREDLRINDNNALYNSSLDRDGVVAVYFVTPKIWYKRNYGNNKVDFMLRNLIKLSENLIKKNIPLLIREAKDYKEIGDHLLAIVTKYKLERLYLNKKCDDEFDKVDYDKFLARLNKDNIEILAYDDETILTPGSVLTQKSAPYTVYTPFKNQWSRVFINDYKLNVLGPPKKQKNILCKSDPLNNLINIGANANVEKLWPAGETEAKKRLHKFIETNIDRYLLARDYPSWDATSRLSPYLSCGVISVRECLREALIANNNEITSGNKGAVTWISELIWRDFYKHLAYAFPRLYNAEPFKNHTRRIKWSQNRELFASWKNGETGFPIVDAAMRQLNHTGWMHNRLRMVVGSFLTKLLFIDWRWGEKYFAENLIDYDFSANNGGWQWCASTGADSVPYFRIFNPELQQAKYDPKSDFIRQYCKDDYNIKPIIDYKKSRDYALKNFKRIAHN